jgi:hypothetical protein
MTTKKMTIRYWNSLERGSRERALCHVFPINRCIVDMLLDEEPNPKQSPFWGLVWKKVRIPNSESYYKTVINKTTFVP